MISTKPANSTLTLPALKPPITNSTTSTVEERFDVLANAFFPQALPHIKPLERIITAENHIKLIATADIRRAIFELNPTKAPGPDGISPETIQTLFETD
mgnify:CR=1 FL=1